jgi:RNA polymerase sigma factor (sigma-70 family)
MSWDGVHALIERAKAGDADAWPPLHALAGDYLLRLAQRLVGNGWAHRSAQDLIQDTWLRAYQAIGDFHGGSSDAETGAMFRAWLKIICGNLHKNSITRGLLPGTVPLGRFAADDSAATTSDPPAGDPTPSHPLQMEERRARIEHILAQLGETDRVIVDHHFFKGWTLKQVAEHLELTYDQVRYRLHDILDRLGDQLNDWS